MDLVPAVVSAIRDHSLIRRGERVVVAVSGGCDSMALLHILAGLRRNLDITLFAAHVDHKLRPESEQDARFVRGQCAAMKVPCEVAAVDVAAERSQSGSLEDAARRLRYQALAEMAAYWSAPKIAVAHHAGDQAETVLLRLLRGSGMSGLRAMAWRRPHQCAVASGLYRGEVVRPMLGVPAADVRAYCDKEGIAFKEDRTNADVNFARNRLRHELLPLLKAHYNPNIEERLLSLAEQLREDYGVLEAEAAKAWGRIAKFSAGEVWLHRKRFERLERGLQRMVFRQAFETVKGDLQAFEYRHWMEVEDMLSRRPDGSVVDLPGQVSVTLEARGLILRGRAAH